MSYKVTRDLTKAVSMTLERPTTFPWPPILLGAAVVSAWLLGGAMPLDWPGIDDTLARVVGLGFGLAGIALLVWATLTLGRHATTILPNVGATQLVTTGPYRFRRNPIYLGEVFILFGLAELTKNIWFVIMAMFFALLVTWLAILPEEAHLEARFGNAYRAYKARTRRWI